MKIELSIKDIDANNDLTNHIKEKGVTVEVINNKLIFDLNNDIYTDIFDDKKFDIEVNIKPKTIFLENLKPGNHFFIDANHEHEFIVLEQYEDRTFVISANNVIQGAKFGNSTKWESSDVRRQLANEYLPVIHQHMTHCKYLPFGRDVSTLDGSDISTTSANIDVVSILTFDEYRKYARLVNNENTESYWLLTPYTTANNARKKRTLYHSKALNTLGDMASDGYCGVRSVMMFINELKVYPSIEE